MSVPPPDRRCTETRKDGQPCTQWALGDTGICHGHTIPPDERRCVATASGGQTRPERKGHRCEAWAIKGGTVCVKHGGSTRHVKNGAAARRAEAKLMSEAARLVGVPVENPLTELALLAGRARALMETLEHRVQKLLDAPEQDGDHDDGESGIRYRGGAGEQIRGEVQLYERAMDRLGRLLVDIGRLNIDERLAKISEKQVDAVVAAIEAGLTAAGVRDPGQRAAAKAATARTLRAV